MSRQSKVRQVDCLVDGRQTFYRFQFHNNSSFDEDINPVSAFDLHFFVDYRNALLTIYSQITEAKLVSETFLICRFKQARPQTLVDFHCSANNFVRDVVVSHASIGDSVGI